MSSKVTSFNRVILGIKFMTLVLLIYAPSVVLQKQIILRTLRLDLKVLKSTLQSRANWILQMCIASNLMNNKLV